MDNMSYSVQWSEQAKKHLAEIVVARTKRAGNRPNTDAAAQIITKDLSLYPQPGTAQPGEHIIGEVPIFGVRVFFDIDVDGAVAVITDMAAQA